ncbi:NeuD/PglB/VioB family sugar acetyltransferase [uncultured Deefgea sp.]|uniref:NeuD/PglB/VioB family sugar acetyltransferase n=1 Tax=uncultured Deefgea sp. TaxID=1304914 RepID=UPI00261C1354|nr:NeuD/PglB/VioB family sugar acetyltransferase [uncultured Deefgea sp.]
MKIVYAIYGASGYGREVLPLLKRQFNLSNENLFFIDDAKNESAAIVNSIPVLNYQRFLNLEADCKNVVVAIANSRIREDLSKKLIEDGMQLISVEADNIVKYDEVSIGSSSIISAFVTLTSNISIGESFQANIYSYVGHDCVIGDYVTFAPAVKCNGNVIIEDHAYIGTGAIIKQGTPSRPLRIGAGAIVGMGAVVTKDVPPGVTVIGNPARPFSKEALRNERK